MGGGGAPPASAFSHSCCAILCPIQTSHNFHSTSVSYTYCIHQPAYPTIPPRPPPLLASSALTWYAHARLANGDRTEQSYVSKGSNFRVTHHYFVATPSWWHHLLSAQPAGRRTPQASPPPAPQAKYKTQYLPQQSATLFCGGLHRWLLLLAVRVCVTCACAWATAATTPHTGVFSPCL